MHTTISPTIKNRKQIRQNSFGLIVRKKTHSFECTSTLKFFPFFPAFYRFSIAHQSKHIHLKSPKIFPKQEENLLAINRLFISNSSFFANSIKNEKYKEKEIFLYKNTWRTVEWGESGGRREKLNFHSCRANANSYRRILIYFKPFEQQKYVETFL